MKILYWIVFFIFNVEADTNLASYFSLSNSESLIPDCEASDEMLDERCGFEPLGELKDLLDQTTTNYCLAHHSDFNGGKITLPSCPKKNDKISGLDNTYPTGATFVLYSGDNDNFVYDYAKNYLKEFSSGKLNIILPKNLISNLKNNPELLSVLNSKRVNIIETKTTPKVSRWIQDSFQFVLKDGKPTIMQLKNHAESNTSFEDRLACELAKKCDIPYYLPPDFIESKDRNSMDSGGNLEVLPGGTFYTGIIKSEGYGFNHGLGEERKIPYMSKNQKITKEKLINQGNKLLELDVSFLNVGHVDEIVNIVKTNKPAPCDFAVMLASPQKAFDLLEKDIKNIKQGYNFDSIFQYFFTNVAHASIEGLTPSGGSNDKCKDYSFRALRGMGERSVISKSTISEIYKKKCINGQEVSNFLKSREYQILKKQNLEGGDKFSPKEIMENNKKLIVNELKNSTNCKTPAILEIPVFFRSGGSYLPDLVNGVVETPPGEASKVLLPRTYFEEFDNYVQKKLGELGIDTSFVHDIGYHLLNGEVHCGTNSARICI